MMKPSLSSPSSPEVYPAYSLRLADGRVWQIRAGDAAAARVVAALGQAMQLRSGLSRPAGRELRVLVSDSRTPPVNLRGPGPAICFLPPLTDNNRLTIAMMQLALVVAREAQARGGLLVHGALALTPSPSQNWEREGGEGGILLAGPGTVGKSTASRRLPPPWRSLCDDVTLVVRDARGQYWAHPWPTWSLFYDNGPGGSWPTEAAVPLRALFFLNQSPDDRVEPLNPAQATAMLLETVQQASRALAHHLAEDEAQALHQEQLAAINALTQTCPAYLLHLSLTGSFWQEIERALQDQARRLPTPTPAPGEVSPLPARFQGAAAVEAEVTGDSFIVYTGNSMNPTLVEPDVLDVQPYADQPVRPGDVVYFWPPVGDQHVVHRVVRVTPAGIRTRGDHNPQDDPYWLQPSDIIGRVVAAQRGQRRRRVAGGWQGRLVAARARLWRIAYRSSGWLLHRAYFALADSGWLRRCLPSRLRPRLLRFQVRQQLFLKLMLGGRQIGQCDSLRRRWRIRRPFRLWVDEAALPCPLPCDRQVAQPGMAQSPEAGSAPPEVRRSSPYWPNPAVVCQEGSDGWAALINTDAVSAIALNPTGVVVWRLVDGRRSEQEIVAAVCQHFQDAPASVANDVLNLLERLAAEGIIGYEEPLCVDGKGEA